MLGVQRTVTVGASSVAVLPANPKRHGLLLSADGTNTISVSFAGTAVLKKGITLTTSQNTVYVCRENAGDLIEQPVTAIASASSSDLTYIEVYS